MHYETKPTPLIIEIISPYIHALMQLAGTASTRFKSTRKTIRHHKKERQAISELMNLTDMQLRDIGLSRDDILYASTLLPDQNPTAMLQHIVKQKHR